MPAEKSLPSAVCKPIAASATLMRKRRHVRDTGVPRGRNDADAVHECRSEKPQDEPRNDLAPRHALAGLALGARAQHADGSDDRENERRSRQLDDRRVGAGFVAVSEARRDDGRRVVDRPCPPRRRTALASGPSRAPISGTSAPLRRCRKRSSRWRARRRLPSAR